MNTKKKSRKELVKALAYCVEALCSSAALVDAAGAVDSALSADESIWQHFGDDTKQALTAGLGHKEPNTQPAQPTE